MLRHIVFYRLGLMASLREARKPTSAAQKRLWSELKGRRMAGFRFERRCALDRYVVDFYCRELALAVEVDDPMRPDASVLPYERERDVRLRLCGVAVLRFSENEVIHNLDGVLARIRQSVRYLPWRRSRA
jgi:very-short-patch-repair endonuclease